jgi:hypothetical protein
LAELVAEFTHQLHRVKCLRCHLSRSPEVIGSPTSGISTAD